MPWKLRRPVGADLQSIYRTPTAAESIWRTWRRSGKPTPVLARSGGGTGRGSRPFQLSARYPHRDLCHQQRGITEPRSLRKIIKVGAALDMPPRILRLLRNRALTGYGTPAF